MIARVRKAIPGLLQLAGLAAIVIGFWRISATGAVIAAGIFAVVVGVAVEH